MFYFDEYLKKRESEYAWDKALAYLENLFVKERKVSILNSLIGFSWYYLIEGPIDSREYGNDENQTALEVWEKYLEIGFKDYAQEPSFCFIAGYTLLMHGFYISNYRRNSEEKGKELLSLAARNNENIGEIANLIIVMNSQKKYEPNKYKLKYNNLFNNGSLLDNYFKELYY